MTPANPPAYEAFSGQAHLNYTRPPRTHCVRYDPLSTLYTKTFPGT